MVMEAQARGEVQPLQLDSTSLVPAVEGGLWSKDLIDEVTQYGRIKEVSAVHLSKLKDEEA